MINDAQTCTLISGQLFIAQLDEERVCLSSTGSTESSKNNFCDKPSCSNRCIFHPLRSISIPYRWRNSSSFPSLSLLSLSGQARTPRERWPRRVLVGCIGYRKRRPPKRSLSLLPHSSSIIDTQLSLEKAARLSVDVFDEYFSRQTGHPTLSTTPVCGYRGYTCIHMRPCTYMCMS